MSVKKKASNYKIGRRLEYRYKEEFSKIFDTVIRSAGSHSKFDLIFVDEINKNIFFLQIKKNNKFKNTNMGKYNVFYVDAGKNIKEFKEFLSDIILGNEIQQI